MGDMKKAIKTVGIIVAVFVLLLVGLVTVFYTEDLPRSTLEGSYFTEHSHYVEIKIRDLDDQLVSISIHYTDVGEETNPVVVLLHGAFSSLHTFDEWTEVMVENGYRVISLDQANHGLSGNYSDGIVSMRRNAAVVRELLFFLNVDSAFVVGNSMGGGVSWFFASEYHGIDGFTVHGILLIDAAYPTIPSGAPDGARSIVSNPLFGRLLVKMTPRFLIRSALKDVYGSASTLEERTVDRYFDLLRKEGNRTNLIGSVQETIPDHGLSGEQRLDRIKEDQIPVLVLWGAEDTWISSDYASDFKERLDLDEDDVLIFDGLGHVPMEENPAATIVPVMDFFNKITP